MYIYRLHLCIDFQFLDDDKTLDLSIGNMRLKDWVLPMSTLLHPGTLSKYLVTSKNVIQAGMILEYCCLFYPLGRIKLKHFTLSIPESISIKNCSSSHNVVHAFIAS